MSNDNPTNTLDLRSLVKSTGEVEVSLIETPIGSPEENEVVVQIEASPINPSDLGLLLAAADLSTAQATGTPERPVVTAKIPEAAMRGFGARLDQSLPVGNEGAGTVVAAGSSPAAQDLLGKKVSLLGGGMYTTYRRVNVAACMPLPDDASAADGASSYVNPLTALGMTETMRREGHTALVHTAAASNLGQMLNKICIKDGIALVNIVRKPEQEKLLREIGATHVCDSSSPTFMKDLIDALVETGATIAFDAIGGGKLAGQILTAMEAAAVQKEDGYSRYGSSTFKQVYIYGGLNRGPTEFNRAFGMSWSMGGWLLMPFLQKIGDEDTRRLKERVSAELKTTFASHYTKEVSLQEALQLDAIAAYAKHSTGEKYLINPASSAG
ncbi:NADPH2:quinone reductase [Antricoccus suffuscus]|uniref:NADPH2:quinone reductase n=1 Tax=Antricoccus suffuscus TaxID=1629062 RepID=A0A2T0ZVX5_9ACTN|nr:zinc-binding dehydrogenase [Antricoccus suffuscus]PRZ40515.1 NADPH2:quinone reductase [Antricoccus suffuscus]